MRFLIFLLLGTLIFGATFPAFIVGIGVLAMILLAVIVFFAARSGNSFFKVYTDRSFQNQEYNSYTEDNENSFNRTENEAPYKQEPDIFEEEGEVIEFPQDALRKDD